MRTRTAVRGAAAVVVVTLLGGGIGYVAARADQSSTSRGSIPAAEPVPAWPEPPIARPAPYRPDPGYPPLPTGLPYLSSRVTGGGHVWTFQRPQGWVQQASPPVDPAGTTVWAPPNEPAGTHGYTLRVSPLSGSGSEPPAAQAEKAISALFSQDQDVQVLRLVPTENPTTVWLDYRSPDNYRRITYLTWIRVPGTNAAGMEVSVTGRVVDEPGLADLFDKVRRSIRMVR